MQAREVDHGGWWSVALACAAVVVFALCLSRANLPVADAASCQTSQAALHGGELTIQGGTCNDFDEVIRVRCQAGSVVVDYTFISEGIPTPSTDATGVVCPAVQRLLLFGHEGDDVLDASAVTKANGFTAIQDRSLLAGQTGDDRVTGSPLPDSVGGGEGDDQLSGGAGDDVVDAGAGNDSLSGKGGADRLLGEAGDDTARGGGGADRLLGASGRDALFGQGGRDFLSGGPEADRLFGGKGLDKLVGGPGPDVERP